MGIYELVELHKKNNRERDFFTDGIMEAIGETLCSLELMSGTVYHNGATCYVVKGMQAYYYFRKRDYSYFCTEFEPCIQKG